MEDLGKDLLINPLSGKFLPADEAILALQCITDGDTKGAKRLIYICRSLGLRSDFVRNRQMDCAKRRPVLKMTIHCIYNYRLVTLYQHFYIHRDYLI